MSRDEENAILALKNAWQGAVTAGQELERHLPTVEAVAGDSTLKGLDFDTFYRVASAHATAAMALRGLIEELQKKAAADE